MIRSYDPSDEDALIQVWLSSTIPGQPFVSEERWRAMESDIRRELLPIADTWVVEADGSLVAFMALLGNLIGGLFTHPDHQGRGYGRALIDFAHGLHDPVFVEVFAANESALQFYRGRGFTSHDQRLDPATGLNQLILRLG